MVCVRYFVGVFYSALAELNLQKDLNFYIKYHHSLTNWLNLLVIVWSALLTFLCSLLFFSNYSSMTIVSIDVGLLLMLIHYSCSVDQSWCITASEQCNGDICIVYGAWSKRHLQQIPGNLARIIKEECDMQYRGPSHTWFLLTRFSNRQCFTTLHVCKWKYLR